MRVSLCQTASPGSMMLLRMQTLNYQLLNCPSALWPTSCLSLQYYCHLEMHSKTKTQRLSCKRIRPEATRFWSSCQFVILRIRRHAKPSSGSRTILKCKGTSMCFVAYESVVAPYSSENELINLDVSRRLGFFQNSPFTTLWVPFTVYESRVFLAPFDFAIANNTQALYERFPS